MAPHATEDTPHQPTEIASPTTEVEAKFGVEKLELLDPLAAATEIHELTLGPARVGEETDAYYDTADYRLMRAGYVLRIRQKATGPVVTIKGLATSGGDAVHERFELEGAASPSAPLDIAQWPKAVQKWVRAWAGKSPRWISRCTLIQERTRRAVQSRDPKSSPVSELSLDRVTVMLNPSGPSLAEFGEVELELAPGGDRALFQQAVDFLADMPGFSPQQRSKLERGVMLAGQRGYGCWEGHITPDMPMAEAGRHIWRTQLLAMMLNEAGVRSSSDIEYVHEMRVAIRRARVVERLCGPFFVPETIAPFHQGLRQTTRLLSPVRDLDVALSTLDGYLRQHVPARPQEAEQLRKYWQKERERAHGELLAWLDHKAYRKFVARFDRFCRTPGIGSHSPAYLAEEQPPLTQVRHVMPGLILNSFAAMRVFEIPLAAHQPVPIETLHALRIAGKEMRYALEFVDPLLGADGTELVAQLKGLQELLGDLNDAAFMLERLHSARKAGVDSKFVRAYEKAQTKRIAKVRTAFPRKWEAFLSSDNRGLLGRALARL